jgi:serine phosphatase RsbU (regulator of sigma subunit)
LPESPQYLSAAVSLPYERVGNSWYGGDWFAGRQTPDGALWVIVADITGHGYCASLLAGGLPGIWQACWDAHRRAGDWSGDDRPLEPADVLAAMHDLLRDCLPEGVYVECTLLRLSPEGEAMIAPAGGSRVLLRRAATGRRSLLKLRGAWLGLRRPEAGEQRTWRLDAGDELVLGTDGLFDQFADHNGPEMTQVLSEVPETERLQYELQRRLQEALRRVPQKDDITMVLLRRRTPIPNGEELNSTLPAARGTDDVPV